MVSIEASEFDAQASYSIRTAHGDEHQLTPRDALRSPDRLRARGHQPSADERRAGGPAPSSSGTPSSPSTQGPTP